MRGRDTESRLPKSVMTPAMIIVLALLSGCLAACGSTGRSTSSSSSSPPDHRVAATNPATSEGSPGRDGYFEGDDDSDDFKDSHKDEDDASIRSYGRSAGAREQRTVSALIKRYYALGASGNGARACALIVPSIARRTDFSSVAPEAFASVAGSSLFHNKTCAEVESLLFQIDHRTLAAGAAGVTVIGLRVNGSHGIAELAFKGMPERHLAVRRDHGRWRVDALLDGEYA
jgi:hypothetical protein